MVNTAAFTDLRGLVTARISLAVRADSTGRAVRLLDVIAAAGVGPVLPVQLLAAALDGGGASLGEIRDHVVSFGTLIFRGKPGTDQETVGIAHRSLLDPICAELRHHGLQPAGAHKALVAAQGRAATAELSAEARRGLEAY